MRVSQVDQVGVEGNQCNRAREGGTEEQMVCKGQKEGELSVPDEEVHSGPITAAAVYISDEVQVRLQRRA